MASNKEVSKSHRKGSHGNRQWGLYMLVISKADVKVASDLPELMLYKKKKNSKESTVHKANRKIFFLLPWFLSGYVFFIQR